MSPSERCVRCRIIQAPHRRSYGFQRRGADRGGEATEQFVVPRASDLPWPELVSQKVKRDIRVPPFALTILTIDDLGFGRMHLQAALCQAGLKLSLEGFSFLLAVTVHQSVVCIPTPWKVWVCPCHPEIERIVEKNVRQNWAIGLRNNRRNIALTRFDP